MEPDRQHAIALIERADLLMVDGNVDDAHDLLERALDVDPLNVEAKRMLAGMARQRAMASGVDIANDPEQASFVASEIDELKADARRERAMGHEALADSLMRRAEDMDPGQPAAHLSSATPDEYSDYATSTAQQVAPSTEPAPTYGGGPNPVVGNVTRFLVGAGVGYLLLYGSRYTHYLPSLHSSLHMGWPGDALVCTAMGAVATVLLTPRHV